MRMRFWYIDCHDAELCYYLVIQKTYYVHYKCFTSICDLFTDSPSYKDVSFRKAANITHGTT
jgi:hypothetical protein